MLAAQASATASPIFIATIDANSSADWPSCWVIEIGAFTLISVGHPCWDPYEGAGAAICVGVIAGWLTKGVIVGWLTRGFMGGCVTLMLVGIFAKAD